MLIEVTRSVVARPSEVFAIVAGIENWPRIMCSVRSVEVLTSGTIDVGTRFRITRTMLGLEMTDEVDVVAHERPRRLRLASERLGTPYELDHLIDAVYRVGTRITMIFETKPSTTAGRTVGTFMMVAMGSALRHQLERDLIDLAAALPGRHEGGSLRSG